MRVVRDFAMDGQRARSLAILLPGALQQPEDLIDSGFVDAVRRRKLSLDLALVDPAIQFIGEVTDGATLRRLHDSVILPARLGGYEEIWLAGISVGGFISIMHANLYPGLVNGLCLLAPYLGSRIIGTEILAAGGLASWCPPFIGDGDAERSIWHWLKMHRQPTTSLRIHLGYGQDDRFATNQRLMADVLAPDCIDIVPGGHDWPVWLQLWENFLDRSVQRFTLPQV